MRKTLMVGFAATILALTASFEVSGCKTTSTPPAWAVTAPQRTVGDVIAGANAAVLKYEADVAAKVPGSDNADLKAIMSGIQKSLAIAIPAYKAWSNALKTNPNAEESADLVGAITAIETALQQLPSSYKGGN